MERAVTCMTVGVSSPAILYILGIMSSRPWEAVKRGGKSAALEGSVHGAGSAAFALQLGDDRDRAPDVALALRRPLIGELGHGGGGRNGINCNDFGEAVGHGGGCFVAVEDCCL